MQSPTSVNDVILGTGRYARAIFCGYGSTCAVLDNDELKCWGLNRNDAEGPGRGILGHASSTTDNQYWGGAANQMGANLPVTDVGTDRTVVDWCAGHGHACARLDNSKIKCWGSQGQGQCGYGDTQLRGHAAGTMGDNLDYVDLGSGRSVREVRCFRSHTCALLDNDGLKCWGEGRYLGYGHTNNLGDGSGEMGDSLPAVDVDGTVRAISQAGYDQKHTCVILSDGGVKCWGNNARGELGYGDTQTRGDGPNEMGANLPKVDLGTDSDGTAYTATQIWTGGYGHASTGWTCAILNNGGVKCWGGGENSQKMLGYNTNNNRGDAPGEMGNNLPFINLGAGRTAISGGSGIRNTCVLLDDHSIKCWGQETGSTPTSVNLGSLVLIR